MSSAPVSIQKPHPVVETGLIVTAVAALLLGTVVYLLDREWVDSMFLAPFADYQWPTSAMFGVFGGFLPALMHAYAIPVLVMVALRPWPWTRPCVCLLWFIIASFLEWLQSGTGSALLAASEKLTGDNPLMAYLKRYSLQGTFDYLDLLAAGIGCLTAIAVTIAIELHSRQRIYA